MSGINRINSGSTLPLSTNFSVGKQTPNLEFGNRIQAGLNTATSVVGSGLGIAGNTFGGGPAILSAAVSSAMTLTRSPSAVNTTYAGLSAGALSTTGSGGQLPNLSGAPSGGSAGGLNASGTGTNALETNPANSNFQAQHEKNLELLGIQSKLQQENLVFSSLSNAMKTRHDTAKNSISNLR
ncbi:MAG: hypothetical protein FWG75_09985 [Cystobacterineae bacterium]|nr:hypothetical protein [Cystobacterineae bacterium]